MDGAAGDPKYRMGDVGEMVIVGIGQPVDLSGGKKAFSTIKRAVESGQSGGSEGAGGRVLEGKWGGNEFDWHTPVEELESGGSEDIGWAVQPVGEKEAIKAERERLRARRKAIRLALEGLGEMIRKIAFDAAMYEDYGQVNYLLGRRLSERKTELRQAEEVLRGMLQEE